MNPKLCNHCSRPLYIVMVCENCRKEVEGLKSETLVLIAGAILLVGIIVGSLI